MGGAPQKEHYEKKETTKATRAQRKVSEKWPSLAKRNIENRSTVRENNSEVITKGTTFPLFTPS